MSVTYIDAGKLKLPHLTMCNARPYKTGLNVYVASDEEIYEATYEFEEMIEIPYNSSWKLEGEVLHVVDLWSPLFHVVNLLKQNSE